MTDSRSHAHGHIRFRFLKVIRAAVFAVLLINVNPSGAQEGDADSDPSRRLKELEAQEAELARQLQLQSEQHRATPEAQPDKGHAIVSVKPAKESTAPVKQTKATKEKSAPTGIGQKPSSAIQAPPDSIRRENLELQSKYAGIRKDYAALEEKCAKMPELEKRTAAAEESVRKLAKELDETRSRLLLAETELERVSARSGARPRDTEPRRAELPNAPVDLRQMPGSASQDMPLATVLTESVSLRTGPGGQYSTLMTVPQGTSLAVESRQGEWLRVITPMGARAWVNSAAVQIGSKGRTGISGKSAPAGLPMMPDQSGSEDAAFKSITGALKNQKNK